MATLLNNRELRSRELSFYDNTCTLPAAQVKCYLHKNLRVFFLVSKLSGRSFQNYNLLFKIKNNLAMDAVF